MLDLNLDIAYIHPSSSYDQGRKNNFMEEDGEALEETSRAQVEVSVASNSSIVVNFSPEEATVAPRDENSSNNCHNTMNPELIFDIFRNNTEGRDNLVTQELFPEKSESLKLNSPPFMDVKRSKLWLGLSRSMEDDDEKKIEMTILPQKIHQQQKIKKRRGPRSRSSQFRGVTFYRRTGRWESHIWDCGKQVYLGGFDTAHAAARAYDRAAIRFRGVDADINFKLSDYDEEMKQMKNLSKEAFIQILRRQSNGFARSNLKFRAPLFSSSSSSSMGSSHGLGDSIFGSRILNSMHNLDLSLGISPANSKRNPQLHGGDKKLLNETVQAFRGLPLASQSTTTWPAISELVSTCQGRPEGKTGR